MLESGVCKAGTSGDIYDFFRNRIMFPIWDQIGNIIAFTWRVLDPNDNPKYLNITNTSLYDKSKVLYGINFVKKHISEHNKIIVVEWNMDVIALHRLWLPIAVATCWTSLSHEHIKLLKRHTDHVYFSFDNDDAGFSATVRWLKLAFEQDLYPQVLQISQLQQYGKCKDIDDLANAWWTTQDLLSTAVDALEFVIQQLWIKYNLSNPVDKKKCVDTIFEIIKSINDLSITQHYIGLSSKLLDISEETLLWQYKSRYKKIRFSTNKPQEEKMNIDHNSLIDALFQEELQTHYQWSEKVQYILSYYERLLAISKIEKSNSEESKGYILWRDKELDGLDNEKKEQFIYNVIIKRIDELLKSIVKLSSIGTIEKTELMEMRRRLR
jgi:DNA primase